MSLLSLKGASSIPGIPTKMTYPSHNHKKT
jgi:hypothetical protein